MDKHHYVVIMAGGIGTRFWPMSRTSLPKQFLDILHTGKTLIQQTFERFAAFIPTENIYVVTSEDYVSIVESQLPAIPRENILGEPSRKNTAPCIAYSSFKLIQLDPDARLIVAPADHMITDNEAFQKVALDALRFVEKHNAFITLGINPTHPNTGYGYIQYEQPPVSRNVYKVKTFTEKPNLELARTFVASGEFLWNAGIFVWRVSHLLAAFERYLPEMYELFVAQKDRFNTPAEQEALTQIYPFCTNISIDFGVMEKADNVYVIPSSFGWSDLGSWKSAYEHLKKDGSGNAVTGSQQVMLVDTANCIVHSPDNKLLVLQGLEDYILVDTGDVLLVCRKEKEQEIKEFVSEVKRLKGDKYL